MEETKKMGKAPKAILITLSILVLAAMLLMVVVQKQRKDAEEQAYFEQMRNRSFQAQLSPAKDPALELLDRDIARSNKKLPQVVEEGISFDKVGRTGRTVSHYYTWPGVNADDFDQQLTAAQLKAAVLDGICRMVEDNPGVRSIYRDGFVYEFVYNDSQGALIATVDMTMQDCP